MTKRKLDKFADFTFDTLLFLICLGFWLCVIFGGTVGMTYLFVQLWRYLW